MQGALPVKRSYLGKTAAVGTETLFRVPEDAGGDYLVSIYIVDRTANGPSAVLRWTDDTGVQTMGVNPGQPNSTGLPNVFVVHANAGTDVTFAVSGGGGGFGDDYDVFISIIRL